MTALPVARTFCFDWPPETSDASPTSRYFCSSTQLAFSPSGTSVTCGIRTTPPTLGETSARRHFCIGITKRTQFRNGATLRAGDGVWSKSRALLRWLLQSHAWASAILVDELDAGSFERVADGKVVGCIHQGFFVREFCPSDCRDADR